MKKSYTLLSTVFILCISTFYRLEAQVISDSLKCVASSKIYEGQHVLEYAEVMPEFSGGESELITFIAKNLKYPNKQKEVQATVYVTFIVDTKGQITQECIYKCFSANGRTPLESEVLRVIRLSPKWKPGEQNGKSVPVRYYLPIRL